MVTTTTASTRDHPVGAEAAIPLANKFESIQSNLGKTLRVEGYKHADWRDCGSAIQGTIVSCLRSPCGAGVLLSKVQHGHFEGEVGTGGFVYDPHVHNALKFVLLSDYQNVELEGTTV